MYHRLILYCTMEELLHSLVVKRSESENENVASDRDRTRAPDHDSVAGRVLHQRASGPAGVILYVMDAQYRRLPFPYSAGCP